MYILFQCGKNFWSEYMYKQLSTVYSPCWQGVGRLKSSLYLISSRDPRLQLTEGCPDSWAILWIWQEHLDWDSAFLQLFCFVLPSCPPIQSKQSLVIMALFWDMQGNLIWDVSHAVGSWWKPRRATLCEDARLEEASGSVTLNGF